MQIMDVLGQMGGFQSIARELGVSEGEAASGAGALLPAILGGMKKQAQSHPAGLEGLGRLGGLLGGLLGGRAADAGGASSGATGSGLISMLDLNGDGNPLDDILRMAGKAMR